jgi:glutamyl-Q tRNA(Asp) synthetase
MTGQAVFRFAPSPNGELHLGHALSALSTFELAGRLGGRFLLRIEDIDIGRSRPRFVDGIYRDLAWLGIEWEEPVLVQSRHFDIYVAAAERLRARGLLYPCFATRAEINDAARIAGSGRDPDGAALYPGLYRDLDADEAARRIAAGEPYVLRLHMQRALAEARLDLDAVRGSYQAMSEDGVLSDVAVRPERWGDAVIVRKDVPTSYHLSVVVDDARQGVTHVTRGRDLLAATDLHRLLQILLGLPAPIYHHHRLMTDASGRKLAKSAGDTSLRRLREQGATPRDIRKLVGLD